LLPGSRSEHEYDSLSPSAAAGSGPVKVTCAISNQAPVGIRPVRTPGEGIQHGLLASRRQLEHNSRAESAASHGRAVEIARRVSDQTSVGVNPARSPTGPRPLRLPSLLVGPSQRARNLAHHENEAGKPASGDRCPPEATSMPQGNYALHQGLLEYGRALGRRAALDTACGSPGEPTPPGVISAKCAVYY
jgi:hypothetical protein